MEIQSNIFYETLIQYPYLNNTEKYGLLEESISIIKKQPENSLLDVFLFNSCGLCVFRSKFNNPIDKYDKFLLTIKNISVSLFQDVKSKSSFSFEKIYFGNYKLYFLLKGNLAFVGLFNKECNKSFAKLLLIHLFVALINFKGDTIEKVSRLNTVNNRKVFDTIQSFLTKTREDIQDFKTTDLFEFMIFEQYFIRCLCIHFKKLCDEIFKPEDMNLSYIKLKNMYVVEISSGMVLFDWLKLRRSKKMIKFYHNRKLWDELIFHSKQMMDLYINDHRNSFSNTDSSYRFVKFECTSTFPRMTFIIKFLPLLKGLAFIHVYSQKKLSRMSENSEQQLAKGYKEIDLLFGCEIKTNANLDFRYSEPKKLQLIEKFLIEFLISIRNIDIFRDQNFNRELKYFNYSIISAINSVPSDTGSSTIENLLNKINAKLLEIYYMVKSGKTLEKTISVNSKIFADMGKMDNLLLIQKEEILKDLFEKSNGSTPVVTQESPSKTKKTKNAQCPPNKTDNSLDLSKIEEPFNGNVTIDQSRDMSVIFSNPNTAPKKKSNLKKDINLDKLIDMSSIMHNTLYSNNGGIDDLIRKGKSPNQMIDNNNNEKDKRGNSPQLNIKVPNPKEDIPPSNKRQKLILLDEKETNIPSTFRELLPNGINQKNGMINNKIK